MFEKDSEEGERRGSVEDLGGGAVESNEQSVGGSCDERRGAQKSKHGAIEL